MAGGCRGTGGIDLAVQGAELLHWLTERRGRDESPYLHWARGSTHPGASFARLFTRVVTGNATISSAGTGAEATESGLDQAAHIIP
jgi:hypothetical protein